MSQENVDLHRRGLETFNARDVEAFIALADPEIEFHSFFETVGGDHHGHDGIRRWFRDLEDAWGDELRLEPEAYFDVGEHTLAFYVLHGRGRQSGAEVARPAAQVLRWRGGLCVYLKVYADKEDAFRDLGVSEDALQRLEP